MADKNTSIRFINAGAGSGKTTELAAIFCERLIGHEIDRHTGLATAETVTALPPDGMLLTTYTKAAAGEFKEKIKKTLILNSRADLVPDIDSAMIGTIDSICDRYIRRYWYLLGMSPNMEVRQTEELRDLLAGLLNDIAGEDDVRFFNEYADLMSVLKYEDGRNAVNYDFWKEDVISLLNESEAYALDADRMEMSSKLSLANLSDVPASGPDRDALRQGADLLRNYLGGLNARNKAGGEKAFRTYVEPCLAGPAPDTGRLLDFIRWWSKPAPAYIRNGPSDFYDAAVGTVCPVLSRNYRECCARIFDIAGTLRGKFDAYKREHNIIGYADLESRFLELLDKPEVRSDIADTLKYVMVDEFQDINFIQMRIYEKLSEIVDRSCWVGDPKQSIYGFRGSNSALLNQVVRQFPPVPASKGDKEDEPLVSEAVRTGNVHRQTQKLGTSHRSLPALVEKVNEVFTSALSRSNIMEEEALAPPEIQLVPCVSGFGKVQQKFGNQPFIHSLSIEGKNNGERARHLAEMIRSLVEGKALKVADRGASSLRDIRYGDIAVLADSNAQCGEISNALAASGIPVTSLQKRITEQAETALVLAMLSYVMEGDKLSYLEINKLWNDVCLGGNLGQVRAWDPQAAHPGTIYGTLDSIREDKPSDSIYNILKKILSGCDLYHYVARWADADKRKRNLDAILLMAEEFNSGNYGFSVNDFKAFLSENESEQEFDNDGDTVKVLTYHKAKGLEWKVVFMNNLDEDWAGGFRKKSFRGVRPIFIDNTNPIWQAFEKDAGMAAGTLTSGPLLAYIPPSTEWPDVLKPACRHRSGRIYDTLLGKDKAEKVRLMYVAFTRAENHIVLLKEEKTKEYPLLDLLGLDMDSFPALSLPPPASSAAVQGVPMIGLADAPAFRPRKQSPSEVRTHVAASLFRIEDAGVPIGPVDLSVCPGLDERILGTCVHHFMAAHRWAGRQNAAALRDCNEALAGRILHAFSMDAVDAVALARSAEEFRTFLEDRYGSAAEVEREYAVRHHLPDGRYADGEIDLLLSYNDSDVKHYVIVDYKNVTGFSGTDPATHSQKYLPQLCTYRAAVLAADCAAVAEEMYLFYPVQGKIMRITRKSGHTRKD